MQGHRDGTSARRRTAALIFIATLLALAFSSCGSSDEPNPAPSPQPDAASSAEPPPTTLTPGSRPTPSPTARGTSEPPAEHETDPKPRTVVLISVDGLNPEGLRMSTPGFSTLMEDGAWTLNARTTVEETDTLPNHASMLTARPVTGPTGTHVTFNTDVGGTLASVSGDYIPSMFDVAHDHGLETAFFAEKTKLAFLTRSWDNSHGAVDRSGEDDGRGKLDLVRIEQARVLVPHVLAALGSQDPPQLLFLHIAGPDATGHATGFMNDPYLATVDKTGEEIDQVIDTISENPVLRGRTTIIVTADHGGRAGKHHDDETRRDNYQVPFFVWGAGVRSGSDLYALNENRKDPGGSRPGYAGPQPIRNMDAAPLVLRVLGLPPLDDSGMTAIRTR